MPHAYTLAFIGAFTRFFSHSAPARPLLDLSEAELAARGYDRDGLVRSYIVGLGLN